jgi:hypothetical protein
LPEMRSDAALPVCHSAPASLSGESEVA